MSLHVAISGWLLGPPSGANRRLLALLEHATACLAADERITVLHAPGFSPPPMPRVTWRPIRIPSAPTWRRVLAERRLLAAALADLGATVLDHGFLPVPAVHVPTCLLVHDVRGADGLTRWPRWLARTVLRRSCARAAAVVVPSAWTAGRLGDLVPAGPMPVVVPNGVEAAALAERGPGPGAPAVGYLLHVGHIEGRKNLAVVVRALAVLPAAERPELWLAGRDAGELGRLTALAAQLQVGVWVKALGSVPEAGLPGLYARSRAVVVPSLHEGFGLCALEGLAHGRPVLASREGALPEVLGDQGQLLPAGDATAWARAIAATGVEARDAERARRARAAEFAWPTAARLLVDVWRRVHAIGAAGPRGAATT